MNKGVFSLMIVACLMIIPIGVQAYTVTIADLNNDAIGAAFETTSITYFVNEDPFRVDIATAYQLAGELVGGWQTLPADLLLDGAANGVGWDYAIPLVTHGGFTAGQLYTIGSLAISDNFDPGGGYIYNHNVPVWLATGTATGFGGSWADTATGISYVANGWYWSDTNPPGDYLNIGWATATCANDPVNVPAGVPEPTTMLLLGLGLLGMGFVGRKKLVK